MSREEFQRFYANRPMGQIADRVYDFFHGINERNLKYKALNSVYLDIISDVGNIGTILDFLDDLQGTYRIPERYQLTDETIWRKVSILMKDHLCTALDKAFERARSYIEWGKREPELMSVLEEWVGIIEQLPASDEIAFEEDGYIPLEEIIGMKDLVDLAFDVIDTTSIITQNEVEESFLPFVLSTGIELNNALYRDIYDCMILANLLEREQIRLHKSSTSRYVRENFIKARFKRLQSNQG